MNTESCNATYYVMFRAKKRLCRLVLFGLCVASCIMIVGCSTTPSQRMKRAIDRGNAAQVSSLLKKYSVKSPDWELREAASRGNVEIMKLLLNNGAKVDAASGPATMTLIFIGQKVESMSSAANVDAGKTALMCAAENGHLGAVKYLITHGAHVNQQEDARIFSSIVTTNINNGKSYILDETIVPDGGKSALTYAILGKHVAVAKFLLQNGASYDKAQVYKDAVMPGMPADPLLMFRTLCIGWPKAHPEAPALHYGPEVPLFGGISLDADATGITTLGYRGFAIITGKSNSVTIATNMKFIEQSTATPRRIAESLGDKEISKLFDKRTRVLSGTGNTNSDEH